MNRRILQASLLGWIVFGLAVPDVHGLAEFKKSFSARYAGDGTSEDYKKLVRKAGCNVCHVPGEPKDAHNAFGVALKDVIPGSAMERKKEAKDQGREKEEVAQLLKELEAAFDKVEQVNSGDGVTYGERIREGKLPVDLPSRR
jgi:hypothetical protein